MLYQNCWRWQEQQACVSGRACVSSACPQVCPPSFALLPCQEAHSVSVACKDTRKPGRTHRDPFTRWEFISASCVHLVRYKADKKAQQMDGVFTQALVRAPAAYQDASILLVFECSSSVRSVCVHSCYQCVQMLRTHTLCSVVTGPLATICTLSAQPHSHLRPARRAQLAPSRPTTAGGPRHHRPLGAS